MKKVLFIISAVVLAVAGCSKNDDLMNKINQLEQQIKDQESKFEFALEIAEGPYCYAFDNELSCKRSQVIPFKINGNVEGLKIVPMLSLDWGDKSRFDYEVNMTSASEGVLSVTRWLDVEYDGGEIDCYLYGATLTLMVFNAEGMSSCKNLRFAAEMFYFADDACDLSTGSHKATIDATKAAGSYELTLRHLIEVPEGAKLDDMIDINDLFYMSNAFNKSNTTVSTFELTDTDNFYDEYDKCYYLEKDYKTTITWTATSSEKESHVTVIRRTAKGETTGSGEVSIYISQK